MSARSCALIAGALPAGRPSSGTNESAELNSGVGQAYTPTLIGPNGVVYSINAATLNAVGG